MKSIVLSVFVFAGCLAGQAVDRQVALKTLIASLQELQDRNATLASHRDRINSDVMALAEQSHRPSMYAVAAFTERLTGALIGRHLSALQATKIATEIDTVLHSAGLGTWKFEEAISNLTAALTAININAPVARKVAADIKVVGNEIRGPEGIPAQPLR